MSMMFFPQYARGRDGVEVRRGESVLTHIRRIGGVEIDSECGGAGECGKDIIRVEKGGNVLNEPTDVEKRFLSKGALKPNQRLACQATVVEQSEDIIVFIPDFGRYTILTDFIKSSVTPCP